MKNFFTAIALLFLVVACGGSSPPPTYTRLTFSGAGDIGMFDPSITRDPGTGRLWMSYSSVETSIFYFPSQYWAVSLRLAFSDDNGLTWVDAAVITAQNDQVVVGPMTVADPLDFLASNMAAGIWQSETSSLVYDPGANPGEEWKLIWFQYLNASLTNYFADYSWIAMKMAATPLQLAAATPIKLFGGAGLQPDNIITGAPVYSPTAGAPAIQLNTTSLIQVATGANLSDLDDCIFAEPGLFANTSAVYLAIFCADTSTIPATGEVTEYLDYFRCTSPCSMTDPLGWEYLGRLFTPTDAPAIGWDHFQAPSLVEKNGKTYLLVTPVDTTVNTPYSGCRVYEFVDVNTNQLVRSGGQLVEIARADGNASTHNGACDMFDGIDGGIVFSQFEPSSAPETFRIYRSNVSLP